MSLIQIDKRAVTREDARRLLDESCVLHDPFGVPTVVYRSEDFSLAEIDQHRTERQIEERFGALSKADPSLGIYRMVIGERVLGFLREFVQARGIFNAVSVPCKTHHSDERDAHYYDPEKYRPPAANAVVLPSIKATMSLPMTEMDYRINHHDLSGFVEQWQLRTLWHEFAHGTGAGEPQADAMAAVVLRKACPDQRVLSAIADHRAFRSIFHYFSFEEREDYGWGVVEANDYIASLPDETISGMTEEDIVDMRFQRFVAHAETVVRLGERLSAMDGYRFRIEDPVFFSNAAAELLAGDNTLRDEARHILARFRLACERIPRGSAAYKPDNDLIDPELLAAAQEPPITFIPNEYIPE